MPKSDNKAFSWFEKSANQDYYRAQFNMGEAWRMGKGTFRAPLKAYPWYEKAARNPDPNNTYGELAQQGMEILRRENPTLFY